jgi:hypothetical protein
MYSLFPIFIKPKFSSSADTLQTSDIPTTTYHTLNFQDWASHLYNSWSSTMQW